MDTTIEPEVDDAPTKGYPPWSLNLGDYKFKYLICCSRRRSVFKVRYNGILESDCVVKVTRISEDPTEASFIQRERDFLHSSFHKNIIEFHPILDTGTANTRCYFFCATLFYYDLSVLLNFRREEPMDSDEFLVSEACAQQLIMQILQGLCYVHQKGYVHTRVKKEYVLIDRNGVVKLTGFGRMNRIEGNEKETKVTNALTGLAYDVKDESFAVGLLACELLLDVSPFDSDDLYDGALGSDDLKAFKKQYNNITAQENTSWSALFPQVPINVIGRLERKLSDEVHEFLGNCLFKPKETRSTCQMLTKDAWVDIQPNLDVIQDELVTPEHQRQVKTLIRQENEAIWFEEMEFGQDMLLVSILASCQGESDRHLHLPFTIPTLQRGNSTEIRQKVEYNLLQIVDVAVNGEQYLHLTEELLELLQNIARSKVTVLHEGFCFRTAPGSDLKKLQKVVLVVITKETDHFHQYLRENVPTVYQIYLKKFGQIQDPSTDIQDLPTRGREDHDDDSVSSSRRLDESDGLSSTYPSSFSSGHGDESSLSSSTTQSADESVLSSSTTQPTRESSLSSSTTQSRDEPSMNPSTTQPSTRTPSSTISSVGLSTNSSTNPSTTPSTSIPSEIRQLTDPVDEIPPNSSTNQQSSGKRKVVLPGPLESTISAARSVGRSIGQRLGLTKPKPKRSNDKN